MSLVRLHLRDQATKENIGTVTNISLDAELNEVRKKVDAEYSLGDYNFVVFGTPLKRKQEKKYLASQCVSKSDQPGIHFCDLALLGGKPFSTCSLTTIPKIEPTIPINCKAQNSTEPQCQSDPVLPSPVVSSLSSSRNAKSKSQIYGEDEIKNATGFLERERMVFSNNKSAEIMADPFFESWTFHEICGVVDVHWTLRKTKLLKSYVQEIDSNSLNSEKDGATLKSVLSNSEKLEKAQFLTDRQYKKFCDEINGPNGESRRDELENQFDDFFSKLKIAQCDVVRSIEQYKKAALKHKDIPIDHETDKNENETEQFGINDCPDLNIEEMNFLAASIKDDYDQLI